MNDRFRKLVNEARQHIPEVSPESAREIVSSKGGILIDVREGSEWRNSCAVGAIHLSKGIIELEIEDVVADADRTIICYCGGGNRSLLAADSLRRMGYRNVQCVQGGFRAWQKAGLPTERGSDE